MAIAKADPNGTPPTGSRAEMVTLACQQAWFFAQPHVPEPQPRVTHRNNSADKVVSTYYQISQTAIFTFGQTDFFRP